MSQARQDPQNVTWSRASSSSEQASLMIGRTKASWLFMETHRIRVGSAVVKAGIVGHVETLEKFRGQGLGRTVMLATIKRFEQKGCDIGFLFGIPVYYQKVGYDTVQDYHATVLDRWRAKLPESGGGNCRRFRSGDLPALARLYARVNARRSGSFVRDAAYWRSGNASRLLDSTLCMFYGRQALAAYAKCGGDLFYGRWVAEELLDKSLLVPEAAARDAESAQDLVGHLSSAAKKRDKRYIVYFGPPDDAVSEVMRSFAGQFRQTIVPNGGVQARIVRLLPLMKKLERDFSARLVASPLAGISRTVRLGTELGDVALVIGNRKVRTQACRGASIRVPSARLMQAAFGYKTVPCDRAQDSQILNVLFPPQIPHSWPLDEGM
jgi:predicted acetyltransferase